jgi:4'-phosphopantetheinyl transferase
LVETEHGKLRLALDQDLQFNVSHSDRLGLYGFTEMGDIGVDIEHVRAVEPMALAQVCFSERERRELSVLSPERRLMAFFDGWVRKEAVIKADGRGMSMPLDSFSVRLSGPARFIELPPSDFSNRWHLESIDQGPNVRSAMAVKARVPLETSLVQARRDSAS